MKLTIANAHTSVLLALLLLTDAMGDVPSLRTLSRDPQIKTVGAITFLEPGKGAHVVRISQTFVGNSADGCDENDNGSNARIMFATFMDPDTLQEKCGIFQRNVSPCFQETVVVGCDLESNTATINLYVVDESFEKGMTTDNPKIGRCKTGQGDIINRAIKVTETFDCLPLTEEEKSVIRFNTCSDSSDYCAEGAYCLFSTSDGYRCISGEPNPDCSCQEDEECLYSKLQKGYYCRLFAQIGDQCTYGVKVSEISLTCNPKYSFCYLQDSCYNSQTKGICVAFSSDVQCSSDDDCKKSTDLCDVTIRRCKMKLKKDECCNSENLCGDGLTCHWREFNSEGHYVCHTACNDTVGRSPCDENEFCAHNPEYYYGRYYSEEEYYVDPYEPHDPERRVCKPYAGKGKGCGSTWFDLIWPDLCSPELVCVPDYDYRDIGVCWPPGRLCQDVSDCPTEEYCHMLNGSRNCYPRLLKAYGCDPSIEKICQEGLECRMNDNGRNWGCADYDDTCSGQSCGGPDGIKCDCICDKESPICIYADVNLIDSVGYPHYDYECDPDLEDVDCLGFCTCGSISPP